MSDARPLTREIAPMVDEEEMHIVARGDPELDQRTNWQVQREITSRLPGVSRRAGAPARVLRAVQNRRLIANYLRDDGDALATIIAFNALFSLLPLILVVFTLLGVFTQREAVQQQIQEWVQSWFPESSAEQMLEVVEQGRENLGQISVVALASILIGGSRLFNALDTAFARIYRAPRRSFVERKIVAIIMVPLVSLLMAGAAAASTLATVMLAAPEQGLDASQVRWLTGALTLAASYGAAFVMAIVVYAVVPNYRTGHPIAWPGAAVAAAMFVALSQVFPLYVELTGGFGIFGSAFAFALVLMVWLYLLGQIIVIGAEINALAGGRRDTAVTVTERTIER